MLVESTSLNNFCSKAMCLQIIDFINVTAITKTALMGLVLLCIQWVWSYDFLVQPYQTQCLQNSLPCFNIYATNCIV